MKQSMSVTSALLILLCGCMVMSKIFVQRNIEWCRESDEKTSSGGLIYEECKGTLACTEMVDSMCSTVCTRPNRTSVDKGNKNFSAKSSKSDFTVGYLVGATIGGIFIGSTVTGLLIIFLYKRQPFQKRKSVSRAIQNLSCQTDEGCTSTEFDDEHINNLERILYSEINDDKENSIKVIGSKPIQEQGEQHIYSMDRERDYCQLNRINIKDETDTYDHAGAVAS